MKETKIFFNEDNKLNKGHARSFNSRRTDNNLYKRKFEHILPPVNIMNEYEEMHPGTLSRLIDMAEQEQNHRHSMDLVSIENQARATKLGRMFAIVFLFIVCSTTIMLSILGSIISSLIFSSFAFLTIIIVSSLMSSTTRKALGKREGVRGNSHHSSFNKRNNS